MRRRKRNPSPIMIGGIVVGVAALAGVGFLLFRKHEENAILAQAVSAGSAAAQGQIATVTTNDPAPAGDLVVRSAPDDSAPQIGGAEKDGVVTVLNPAAGQGYAEIEWGGGSRLAAVRGFAHSAFLRS